MMAFCDITELCYIWINKMQLKNLEKLTNMIAEDEGFRDKPYKCPKGYLTIGYGFNIDVNGLPQQIANQWLDLIIYQLENKLSRQISFWYDLNDARKSILINMAYQMGVNGLLNFHDMIKALESKDYSRAAAAMKDSVWYKEYTTRAYRLINIMTSGEL